MFITGIILFTEIQQRALEEKMNIATGVISVSTPVLRIALRSVSHRVFSASALVYSF